MEIKKATNEDLVELKSMYAGIVSKMDSGGIHIWNEYYPYEEFSEDILEGRLYLLLEEKVIISAFGLYESVNGAKNFKWSGKDDDAVYLGRLGVNTNYARSGFGTKALNAAEQLALNLGKKFLRLQVGDINIPATNLYFKNGFTKVQGFFDEYSETLDVVIHELGYEFDLSNFNRQK